MTGGERKIKIGEATLGDMVGYLRAEADRASKGRSGLYAVRITATRIFRAVYGSGWQNVLVSEVDIDKLFEDFRGTDTGRDYSRYTLSAYYARLRRTFDIFDEREKKVELVEIAARKFEEETERLANRIQSAKDSFLAVASNYLFTDKAREGYDISVVPISGSKPVALAVPKDLDTEDVEVMVGMLERVCGRVKMKKGERMRRY